MPADEKEYLKRRPIELVYNAHEEAVEARQRMLLAPQLPEDKLPTRLAAVEYHGALMEYFSQLSPHLTGEEPYWSEVGLFSYPIEGRRNELAKSLARYYGVEVSAVLDLFDRVEADDETYREWTPRDEQTVRGLRMLKHWRIRYLTEKRDVEDATGVRTETIQRPDSLPPEAALRVHDLLDQAAAQLGYNIRPKEKKPETKLTDESYDVMDSGGR